MRRQRVNFCSLISLSGSHRCCTVSVLQVKSFIQTDLPLIQCKTGLSKIKHGLLWQTAPQLSESKPHPRLNPPGPTWHGELESHCEWLMYRYITQLRLNQKENTLVLAEDCWRTSWGLGQGEWGKGRKDGHARHTGSDRKWPRSLSFLPGRAEGNQTSLYVRGRYTAMNYGRKGSGCQLITRQARGFAEKSTQSRLKNANI